MNNNSNKTISTNVNDVNNILNNNKDSDLVKIEIDF
jgi:hypothetical protein